MLTRDYQKTLEVYYLYVILMRQDATWCVQSQQGGLLKYLTIDDVCDMLSISRRTFERMRSVSHQGLPSDFFEPRAFVGISSPAVRQGLERIRGATGVSLQPLSFPEPDLHIGRSPRWEQDKLIAWLQENGSRLQT